MGRRPLKSLQSRRECSPLGQRLWELRLLCIISIFIFSDSPPAPACSSESPPRSPSVGGSGAWRLTVIFEYFDLPPPRSCSTMHPSCSRRLRSRACCAPYRIPFRPSSSPGYPMPTSAATTSLYYFRVDLVIEGGLGQRGEEKYDECVYLRLLRANLNLSISLSWSRRSSCSSPLSLSSILNSSRA